MFYIYIGFCCIRTGTGNVNISLVSTKKRRASVLTYSFRYLQEHTFICLHATQSECGLMKAACLSSSSRQCTQYCLSLSVRFVNIAPTSNALFRDLLNFKRTRHAQLYIIHIHCEVYNTHINSHALSLSLNGNNPMLNEPRTAAFRSQINTYEHWTATNRTRAYALFLSRRENVPLKIYATTNMKCLRLSGTTVPNAWVCLFVSKVS